MPYAGGSPKIFGPWAKRLPDEVELVALRLPGRDNRMTEPAFTEWPALLGSAATALAPLLDRPYAFFGHSFGGRIAFELTRCFEAQELPLPAWLFISGCRCPHVPSPELLTHTLPRREFLARVMNMQGTPREALASGWFLDVFEPMMRADMKLHAEAWDARDQQTSVPIAAFSGQSDHIDPPESMRQWGRYTRGRFVFQQFAGGHFFIHSHENLLLARMTELWREQGGEVKEREA